MFSHKNEKNQKFINDYLTLLSLPQRKPSSDYLFEIVTAHRKTIPYESSNLVLHDIEAVKLKNSELLNHFKNGGGGVCYQIHGCLRRLLYLLGFDAVLCSVRIHRVGQRIANSTEDTHCLIVVSLNQNEYIVDLTFGNSMRYPIIVGKNIVSVPGELSKRCILIDDKYALQAKVEGEWVTEMDFKLKHHKTQDFKFNLLYISSSTHFLASKLLLLKFDTNLAMEYSLVPVYQDNHAPFTFFRTSPTGEKSTIELHTTEELAVKMQEYGVSSENRTKLLSLIGKF